MDGLQASLDSAASASEAASRQAANVLTFTQWLVAFFVLVLTVAAFFGYGKFNDILNKAKGFRDEAANHASEAANHAKQVADHAKEVADCAHRVRDALKSIEATDRKATEYLDRIKHFTDEAQAKARDLQSIQITGDVSQDQKQDLSDLAARLDLVEALGLPLDPKSYFARGNAYYTKEDYERAAQCYQKAAQLRPQYDEAWFNWGTALCDQAKTKEGDEADRLFHLAGDKYARAVEIKPDKDEAWYNWGTALSDQAETKEGDEADRLFQLAGDKYARAVEIKPEDHEAWYNWGTTLSDQAKAKDGAAANSLFQQAAEKHARAVQLKPGMHEAWNNWGTALSDQAKTKQGAEADSLFQQAGEKYARAIAIKPDKHEAWYNWGNALLFQGRAKQDEEADTLFQQAEEKYARAVEIKPDYVEAYFNRACTRSLHANAAEALADLKQAINLNSKCREDAKTDPDFEPIHSDAGFRKLVGLDPNKPEQDQP